MRHKREIQMSKENENRKNLRSRYFLTRLMASFGIMLILPVFLAVVNYLWSRNVLEKETIRYNQAMLDQAQAVIDEKLQGIQLYAFELSQNDSLNSFLRENQMEQGELLVEVERVKKQLQRFMALYPRVESAVVYSVGQQAGVSGLAACFEKWPEAAVRLLRGNTDQWRETEFSGLEHEIMRYLETENLYCSFVEFQEPGGEKRVLLVHSLPIWSSGVSYDGVLVAEIDMGGLLQAAGGFIEESGGAFGIVDGDGKVVADIGREELLLKISVPSLQTGRIKDNHSYYLTAVQKCAVNSWSYVMIQPDTLFVTKLRNNRNFTLLMLALLLLLGGFLAYALGRTNYRPVKLIMDKLKSQRDRMGESDGDGDEFLYIERVLDEMTKSVQEVQAVMEKQMPKIRSGMLQSLLNNTVTDYDEFLRRMKECGISYEEGAYTVAVVHVQQFPAKQLEKQALLKALLWELLRETMGSQFLRSTVEMSDDNLVSVINGQPEHLKEEIQECLQVFMSRSRKELQILLMIAVGDPVERLEELPAVCQQTMAMLWNQRGQENFGEILTIEKKEMFRLYYCPAEVRNRISSYVMAGKEELACKILDENYHENFDNRRVTRVVAVSYFIMLIDTILNCYSVSEEEKQKLWDKCNPVAALLAEETPEAMVMIVKGFAQMVGHYIRQRMENHTDSMKYRILKYIREQYTSNDLSLSYVADHFLITPNYLSAFFKEQVGDTFLSYLTGLRLGQARQLLIETDYAVNVIAEKVGYASANTFIRTFKKVENMTPGEYREYARQRAKL